MIKQLAQWLRASTLSTTGRRQSGYATVEFALAIPMLVMVTTLCMWLISVTVTDLRLHSAASSAARILARGQALPQDFKQDLPAAAEYEIIQDQAVVRINIWMNAQSPIPRIPLPIRLTASAVAAREDALGGF